MFKVIYYVLNTLNWIIWIYSIIMVIDAIMSWVPMLRDSVIGKFLDRLVDPYVNLFRKGPIQTLTNSTGLDISFLIGLLLLYFIQDYVLHWIANILLRIFA